MERPFHFVVFGATGFTGQFVAKTLAKNAGGRRWAVAGRNGTKLRDLLEEITNETGIDCKSVPCVICDVGNVTSLDLMAEQARVVLNCVGPYRFCGEPVVKACVDKATDYVDISGEPFFLENMAMKYDKIAKENGCFIIGSCGFDSVPCDIGTQFAVKNFQGTLDAVEAYHDFYSPHGVGVHEGTFLSMIHGIANQRDLVTLRKTAAQTRRIMPKSCHKLKSRGMIFYNEDLKAWCLPFLGSDRSVVQRTNSHLFEMQMKRPVQFQAYMKMPSFISAILLIIWGFFFYSMTRFEFGKKLLADYPTVFSFGMFSKKGPSKKQLETSSFKTHIFGCGWLGKFLEAGENPEEKPQDRVRCVFEGPEAGYVATSAILVACALTTVEDRTSLPGQGGVFTTAAAYSTSTKLISRLEKLGMKLTKI